jgi:hypothetical protein
MKNRKTKRHQYPINFGLRIKQHVLYRENKCRICEKTNVKLEICHLFSRSEEGICYDGKLPLNFVQSPDNASLMCRKCFFRFKIILKFLTKNISSPNKKYRKKICYICDHDSTTKTCFSNNCFEWNVPMCQTCSNNVNQIIEFMMSKSEIINFHFNK